MRKFLVLGLMLIAALGYSASPWDESKAVRIKDAGGEVATVTSERLDVNITSTTSSTRVFITDGDGDYATVDDITNHLKIINVTHAEIHEGEMYNASGVTEALADDNFTMIFVSTSTKYAHIEFRVSAGGDTWVQIYEAPTGTITSGTAVSAYNKYRGNTTIPTRKIWSRNGTAGTIAGSSGTLISSSIIAGGTGGNATGGQGGSRDEFILNTVKNYLILIKNIAGAAKPIGWDLEWYEEE